MDAKHGSLSRSHRPTSRPTTPLRPSSRTSLRSSQSQAHDAENPLDILEPAIGELADAFVDLEANMMHLQLMHESLSRFSESFAAFLYGINMNAFCVDFPQAPIAESFKRARQNEELGLGSTPGKGRDSLGSDHSFLTTDTFVENPPTSTRSGSKFTTPAPASRHTSIPTRGAPSTRGQTARGGRGGTRGSGLARAKPRGSQ